MKYALLSRTFRSGGSTTLGPGQIATSRVVWSCGVLFERVGDNRATKSVFCGLIGAAVDFTGLFDDFGLVARSSIRPRRKAEFEWVGMVRVSLGRRTAIAQTAGVRRGLLLTNRTVPCVPSRVCPHDSEDQNS